MVFNIVQFVIFSFFQFHASQQSEATRRSIDQHLFQSSNSSSRSPEESLSPFEKQVKKWGTHLIPGYNVLFPIANMSQYFPIPKDRIEPVSAFIDLGSQDGNSLEVFLGISKQHRYNYHLPSKFNRSQTLLYLFEGNPYFRNALTKWPQAMSFCPVVIGTEDAMKTFYLHEEGPRWGSSLHPDHQDVRGGKHRTEVCMVNLAQFIRHNFKREDYVIVKMDIEGYEQVILPYLAFHERGLEAVPLIDSIYYERHHFLNIKFSEKEDLKHLQLAHQKLGELGISITEAHSNMK